MTAVAKLVATSPRQLTHILQSVWQKIFKQSFGGTISTDVCEHLGASYLSGIIYLDAIPYVSAFQEVGTSFMGPTIQTLVNPEASATELAEAIVFLVDSCVADGYEISTEKKWLWRGVILSQVYFDSPLVLHGR
ncbi:hypothetical protein N7507_005823 [Penicillium longicatenatum]|nr:hypothetical protein N7507_005823 [Penicillium longicatenatum]